MTFSFSMTHTSRIFIVSFLLFQIIGLSVSFASDQERHEKSDSIPKKQWWNFHFQTTVISQYHPAFSASYSGLNSLKKSDESTTSLSSTLFFGTRLWKGAEFYFNPELSGGSGFSGTTGIAGFPNGEIYRVSAASPQVFIGRAYLKQIFPLSKEYQEAEDGVNQLAGSIPISYISMSIGKYSIMDFFDNNTYSHDPRTQFYNWALMGNGAWDYPANTRGYTYGLTFELIQPKWSFRFSSVMVPKTANGSIMDSRIFRSHAEAFEFEKKYTLNNQKGTFRLMTFFNEARMGSYKEALQWGILHNEAPRIDSARVLGNTKYGFGLNIEQQLNKYIGAFLRAGWNDGKNETWAFTEIDRTISGGIVLNGGMWKRNDDVLGLAFIANGLSQDHKAYLKAGGYGFIIGDGTLSYRPEMITEVYYSLKFGNYPMWLSPDYQFIVNPAYNKDRGPVNAFGFRMHIEM